MGWEQAMAGRTASQHGWLLAGFIVLLSSVFVAMAGISFLLAESRRAISVRQNDTEAVSLAQAGVMRALYDVRNGTGILTTLATPQTIDAGPLPGQSDDDVFILGGKAADFLLANMIPASVDRANLSGVGQRDRLRNWRLRNVLGIPSPALQITQMTVSWNSPGSEGVIRIEINGARVWPTSGTASAPQTSGTPIPILLTTIPQNTERTGNTIWFSTSNVMQNKSFIDVAFRMSDHVASSNPLDASIRLARYTPAVGTRSASFTVKSVGEVRKGAFPFVTWRRLQAEYQVSSTTITNPGNLVSYRELSVKTP